MAQCDYCGSTFRGWGIKHGKYNFCKGTCRDNGAVLDELNDVPAAEVEAFVDKFRHDICPGCNTLCDLDVYRSFRVHSNLLYTRFSTHPELSCRACARKRQLNDLRHCIVFGWWGIPFGPFVTLIQIGRNAFALMRPDTRSSDIGRLARLALAERVARARNVV